MNRAYYFNTIQSFLNESVDAVLGRLLISDEFETSDLQKSAWQKRDCDTAK